MPQLIDTATPDDVKTYRGHDGREYVLVFSDEFNEDGRTFWPGDDPFWEGAYHHRRFRSVVTPRRQLKT
jgi:beta-glucanase (GH16 family)